jgi:uncharacterized DUF497 family protein
MEFEFDPGKSRLNKDKHGIGFEAARALWDDPCAVEIPARTEPEPRFIVTGRLQEIYWSAVITYRDGNVRIISVRRARKMEIECYEKNKDI